MCSERAPDDLSGAGCELDNILWNARLMHQLDRQCANERGLPGRLCYDRIASRKRRGHQASEDGKREIPRRNRCDDAAAVQAQLILLSSRAWKRKRLRE